MKPKSSIVLLMLLFVLTFIGCKKFLDTEPEGRLVLSTIQDYELLLNGAGLSTGDYQVTDFMSDDKDFLTMDASNPAIGVRIYLWKDQFDLNIGESPIFWGSAYSAIYGYNVVINEVDKASTGTVSEKQKLKAEALMRRAFEYLWLVNLYARPYNPITAGTDLAVPYVTSDDISNATPPRATLNFIYQKIIEDLKKAIPDLAVDNNSNKFRGSVKAAYSVLARTYYYMHDYKQASKYAILALSQNGGTELFDYNKIKSQDEIPLISISRQEIYARSYSSIFPRTGGIISTDLLRLLKNEDLRFSLFYMPTGLATFPARASMAFVNPVPGKISFGTSVPEMKLIIAEAAVRNGNLSAALEQLNEFRKFRIATASYVVLNSSEPEEVLGWILTERRLEFAFRGIRWMDMRKLDTENRMPAVARLDFNETTIATLPPGSSKYTLKIPASILYFNPGMPQN